MQRWPDGGRLTRAVSKNAPMMHHPSGVYNGTFCGTTPTHALLTLQSRQWLDTLAEALIQAFKMSPPKTINRVQTWRKLENSNTSTRAKTCRVKKKKALCKLRNLFALPSVCYSLHEACTILLREVSLRTQEEKDKLLYATIAALFQPAVRVNVKAKHKQTLVAIEKAKQNEQLPVKKPGCSFLLYRYTNKHLHLLGSKFLTTGFAATTEMQLQNKMVCEKLLEWSTFLV